MCMHECIKTRGQPQLSFLKNYLCFLRWALSTWGWSNWLGCLGSRSPRILLSSPPQCWDDKHVPPCLAFRSGFWGWNLGPHALWLALSQMSHLSPASFPYLICFSSYAFQSKRLETFQDIHKKIIIIHHEVFHKIWNLVFSTGCYSSII